MKKMWMTWIWGIIFIVIGVAFFANAIGAEGANELITNWWPAVFVMIGIGQLITGDAFNGVFWIVIGAVVCLFTSGTISYNGDIWQVIWPVALILFGIRFMIRPMSSSKKSCCDGEFVGSASVFSGSVKKVSSKDFKGSSVRAVFGGSTLDLRDAEISKSGAIIDVSAIFGGIEILVPKKYPIKVDVAAILGGHDDKHSTSDIDPKLPTITIRGEAIFGGIEIKN